MDNFTIDITAEGEASLKSALEIAFAHNSPGKKTTHYKVLNLAETARYYVSEPTEKRAANVEKPVPLCVHHYNDTQEHPNGTQTLILLWAAEPDASKLPYTMSVAQAFELVKGWLSEAGVPGPEPDHDGDNGAGWRIFTGPWGKVAGSSYGIIGIQPAWAMYGK